MAKREVEIVIISDVHAWIFHGDIFDVTMQHSKWLAKLGAMGYDSLILINHFVNWCLEMAGREKMSLTIYNLILCAFVLKQKAPKIQERTMPPPPRAKHLAAVLSSPAQGSLFI